jgi:predicted ATPase
VLTIRPPAGSRQLPLASLISLLPSGAGPSAPTDAGSHPVQTGLGLVERGLHGLISSGPTLLMVDDAHLLDEVSATVIHQLVVERSVRLLATLRVDRAAYPAGPVATGPVAALWKDRYVLRFDVAPLSDAETDALVGAVLQGQVEGRTLRQIRQATGGNPLFLRELLISARETGVLDDNGGVWRAYGKLGVTGRADLRQALDLHPGEHQS